jgi:hypothetical protein
MRSRFLCFLLASVGISLPPRAPAEDKAKPAVVPFELLPSRHMVVQATINGEGPFRLVFDTGAPLMLVTSRAAKESGIIGKGARAPGLGLFNMMGEPKSIKKFELGGLVAEDVPAVVMDHPTVKAMEELFGRLDGIVGFPFFAKYRMTIDYQAKTLAFQPTDYKPKSTFDALMAMLMGDPRERNAPQILAPSAQWGMLVEKSSDDESPGVEVRKVFAGGPADTAGIRSGDRLLTLDGRWTDSVIDFYEAISQIKPGRSVIVELRREGKPVSLKITPKPGL